METGSVLIGLIMTTLCAGLGIGGRPYWRVQRAKRRGTESAMTRGTRSEGDGRP